MYTFQFKTKYSIAHVTKIIFKENKNISYGNINKTLAPKYVHWLLEIAK